MAVDVRAPSTEMLRLMYQRMQEIRRFEERVFRVFEEGLIRGSTHTYIGMEAVAVGACSALRPDDYITSTHRGHGHCIAKGGDLGKMMAELMGRAGGYCKGKGGSMHIADVDKGILGANGIVGGGQGMATGAGLSAKLRGQGQVCVCFFGDGGINQGAFYENVNLAAIWKLPVIYVCENNHYAMSMNIERSTSVADLSSRAAAFDIPGQTVDGMDVLAVNEAVAAATARGRAGQGPSLLVANTYRFRGHNIGDNEKYRTQDEKDEWIKRDAIARFRTFLIEHEFLSQSELDGIDAAVNQEIDNAVDYGRQSPEPSIDTLEEDIYA